MQIVRKQYQVLTIKMWDGNKWHRVRYSKKRHSPHRRLRQRILGMCKDTHIQNKRRPKEKFILVEDKRWIT